MIRLEFIENYFQAQIEGINESIPTLRYPWKLILKNRKIKKKYPNDMFNEL